MARSAINVLVGATITPLQKQLRKGVGLVKDFGKNASKAIAGGGGIGAAIAGAIGGVSVVAGLKIAVDKFKEVEAASVKLTSTLKAGGNQAGVTTAEVIGFAKEMQAATGIAVSSTLSAASELAKVQNIKGPNFKEAITQAANFAAVMGGDVVSASGQLAQALKNPREGYLDLAAAGVQFSDEQIDLIQSLQAGGDMAGAQSVILEALKAQYEGAAEAAGETLDGSINKLWGSVGGLSETIGGALAPYLKAAVDLMTEWVGGLDMAAVKATAIEYTAKTVGWVVDGLQVMNAAWKTAEALVGGLVSIAISGFRLLAQGVQKLVEGLEYIGVVSEGASESIKSFVDGVAEYEKASWDTTKQSAFAAADAWQKPWESETTTRFFDKVGQNVKKTEDAMKGLGEAVKKGPVEGMKQLSAEAIEAQKAATSSIKDMKNQLDTFGLPEWEAKAREAEKKGASKGQVADLRKLGAQLDGKQLAQSLETPFEKFERESRNLQKLAEAGGISGLDLERAKGKLVGELQQALPDARVQAGGAMSAGSQEARSALLNYKNMARNNDPAVVLQKETERQTDILSQSLTYLKKLSEAKPQLTAFAGQGI